MPPLFLPVLSAIVALFGAAGIAVAPPAPVEPTVEAAQRCAHCGWIESKREIVPGVADPRSLATYEYTLRMADGSSSLFRETLPASWRLGERVMVIDGARPLD